MVVCIIPQTIMTVKSGGSVISCVKIALGRTTVAVLMDTSWSRVTSAKQMFQVQGVMHHIVALHNLLLQDLWGV